MTKQANNKSTDPRLIKVVEENKRQIQALKKLLKSIEEQSNEDRNKK